MNKKQKWEIKQEAKELFVNRAKSQMEKNSIKRKDIIEKMDMYRHILHPDENKSHSYKASVYNVWFTTNSDTIPTGKELEIIAEILKCDVSFLTDETQDVPRKFVYQVSSYTKLSEATIDNIHDDHKLAEQLDYLLTYHKEDFTELVSKLFYSCLNTAIEDIIKKYLKALTEEIKTLKAIEEKMLNDENYIPPDNILHSHYEENEGDPNYDNYEDVESLDGKVLEAVRYIYDAKRKITGHTDNIIEKANIDYFNRRNQIEKNVLQVP